MGWKTNLFKKVKKFVRFACVTKGFIVDTWYHRRRRGGARYTMAAVFRHVEEPKNGPCLSSTSPREVVGTLAHERERHNQVSWYMDTSKPQIHLMMYCGSFKAALSPILYDLL